MAGGRFLILLIVIAAGSLVAALSLSTGDGGRTSTLGGYPAENKVELTRGAGQHATAAAPNWTGEASTLLIGFVAGWLLHWIYALPWAALPRAITDWLLGWRTSAAMVGLAVGCVVILLFY